MAEEPDAPAGETPDAEAGDSSARVLVWMTVLAVVAGALTGLVGGAFRWLLVHADELRLDIVSWAHGLGGAGWLIPVAVSAAAAGLAGGIARLVPLAAGSGIQHVEAVHRGQSAPPPARVVPARFIGGLISIGLGGLVLGREGPTVHMGAAIGAWCAKIVRVTADEVRAMQSVLSGAGLAVAFNAPIGGALFFLEEISHSIRMRYVLWTMAAASTAVMVSRGIVGDHPDFHVADIPEPPFSALPIFAVFGLFVALLGIGYSRLITASLAGFDAVSRIPAPAKATAIGAVIGLALTIDADLVGAGDALTQALLAGQKLTFVAVLLLLVVRFIAGPLSYAAATPGGLFAPMLALGALCGLIYAHALDVIWPGAGTDLMPALMLVGMATFFTAVVRAPLTGVVLVMEMTATTSVALAMITAGAIAVIITQLLRCPPIYDVLRERMLSADSR